jgi:hypothetical protein
MARANEKQAPEVIDLRVRARQEGQVVNQYLAALAGEEVPAIQRRGSVDEKLRRIQEELAAASPADRLKLIRKKYQLVNTEREQIIDLVTLERQFIEIASDYSERTGTPREVWEEVGVSPEVLEKAGL